MVSAADFRLQFARGSDSLSDDKVVLIQEPAARVFYSSLESALAIDKLKSARREARAFHCIRDQVLVLPVDKDEMTDSGILFVPSTAQERQSEGIVIAAGRGRMDANNIFVSTEVEAGDRVLFGKYAGTEIVLRGKICRLMREEEILGVIR
jgi:chaperonin GroES